MKTLQISSEKEFGNLTELLDSLSEDYREFLTHWVEMKESPYSLEYVYARLFIFNQVLSSTGWTKPAASAAIGMTIKFNVRERVRQRANFAGEFRGKKWPELLKL